MPNPIDDLLAAVEDYAAHALPDPGQLERVRASKAVHDPIWGTSVLSPIEIAILDTPLLQRLRGVHQTSLTYLVYPAANHTRFEHSLGVAVVADRLMDALAADERVRSKFGHLDLSASSDNRLAVKLAGLLHDCGHALLSHIGESQREQHEWIMSFVATDPQKYERSRPHELLSYLIVKSEAFRAFWARLVELYSPSDDRVHSISIDEVAGFIIGDATPARMYLADMINGSFDADKLDYLFRDAYFTGLRLTFDIDRLLYAMTLEVVDKKWLQTSPRDSEDKRRKKVGDVDNTCGLRLVVRSSGVSALEQILFCKMQLVVSIYQHQKVRAADSMLSCYVQYIDDEPHLPLNIALETPVDFLRYTDWEWLLCDAGDDYLKGIAKGIRNRDILQRCVVISRDTCSRGLNDLLGWQGEPGWSDVLAEIREAVLEKLDANGVHHSLKPCDIVLDIPKPPSFREASQTPILMPDDTLTTMSSFFPTSSWLATFFAAKWSGHVFVRGSRELRKAVAAAAAEALKEHPDVRLELNSFAFSLAHLDD